MDCDQGVSPQVYMPPLRPAESPIVSSEGKTAFPIFHQLLMQAVSGLGKWQSQDCIFSGIQPTCAWETNCSPGAEDT